MAQNERGNRRDLLADLDLVGEQRFEAEPLADGNVSLDQVVPPHVVDHVVAELPTESTDVAEERRPEQTVTQQTGTLRLQVIQFLRPTVIQYNPECLYGIPRRFFLGFS